MSKNGKLSLVQNGTDKEKALDTALKQIERAFGKGAIMWLGKADEVVEVDVVSTGSVGLDIALGKQVVPGPVQRMMKGNTGKTPGTHM